MKYDSFVLVIKFAGRLIVILGSSEMGVQKLKKYQNRVICSTR